MYYNILKGTLIFFLLLLLSRAYTYITRTLTASNLHIISMETYKLLFLYEYILRVFC